MKVPKRANRRVLAFDPGYDRLGIAVVEGDPSHPTLVWSDCVMPDKGTAEMRLAAVARAVREAIATYTPDYVSLEGLFFAKNVKTALGVAEARGVILAVTGEANLPVVEITPAQVKVAVAGNGSADKMAVALMVSRLITLKRKKRLDDELDAIAVGIAALAIGLSA